MMLPLIGRPLGGTLQRRAERQRIHDDTGEQVVVGSLQKEDLKQQHHHHPQSLPNLYHDKKNRDRSNKRLLTAAQLAEVQHSRNLYSSNLFRLEIQQVLKEATIDYTKLKPLEDFLKSLKLRIDQLEPVDIGNHPEQTYPFVQFVPTPSQHESLSFKFESPKRIDLVGSYLLRTVTRPHLNIDMAVQMPSTIFGAKDHLNYRYFNKRIAYIAEMYRQLRSAYPYCRTEEMKMTDHEKLNEKPVTKTSEKKRKKQLLTDSGDKQQLDEGQPIRPYFFLQGWQGDIKMPVIVVKCLVPKGVSDDLVTETPITDAFKMTSWTIRIFAIPPPNIFAERKLAPSKNNVRFCTTSLTPDILQSEFSKDNPRERCLPPTPMYNGALLDDMRMVSWFHRLHDIAERFSGFRDAVKLLKLWGRKAGHCSSWSSMHDNPKVSRYTPGGSPGKIQDEDTAVMSPVTGFFLSLVCAHVCLANSSGIARAAEIQLFKLALAFLADTNFNENKAIFGTHVTYPLTEQEKRLGLKLFLDIDQSTDKSTNNSPAYNIFWPLQLSLDELQHVAQDSIKILNTYDDPFDQLFGINGHQNGQFCLDWDITIVTDELPRDVDNIPAASSITVSDEKDTQREQSSKTTDSLVTNTKSSSETSTLLSSNRYIDFHTEHPSHYNIAQSIMTVVKRGLANRLQGPGGICLRFLSPSSWSEYQSSTVHHPLIPPPFSWTDISPTRAKYPIALKTLVAVMLSSSTENGDHGGEGSLLYRLADRGVPASSHFAKYFREFWGNSSTRRFQDGAINESIVWKRPTPILENLGLVKVQNVEIETFVPSVPSQIINHLMNRHFTKFFDIENARNQESKPTSSDLKQNSRKKRSSNKGKLFINDAVLGISNRPIAGFLTPTGTIIPHPIAYFSELKSLIISLCDLPLDLKEVRFAETHGILRYADAPAYSPFTGANQVERFSYAPEIVLDCVIEFGKSGGWPSDVISVKKMKAAILNAIKSSLLASGSIKSEIGGLTATTSSLLTDPFLDIVYPPLPDDHNNFNDLKSRKNIHEFSQQESAHRIPYLPRLIYRFRIFHPFEHLTLATALNEMKTEFGDSMCNPTSSTLAAMSDIRSLWFRPALSNLLHSMALKHISFGPSLRLIKTWCASHLFPLNEMNDLIEHIVLNLFNNPAPRLRSPSTPHVAFGRFLHFLSTYDWEGEGLYINADLNLSSIPQPTMSELKNARQRNLRMMKNFTNVSTSSNSIRSPYFWISSVLDPHCQLIELPSLMKSKQLIDVAQKSLSLYYRYSTSFKKGGSTWRTSSISPQLNFLPTSSWRQLFYPDISSRFDFSLHLSPTIEISKTFGETSKHQAECKDSHTLDTCFKRPFKNLPKSKTASVPIPVTAIREAGQIKIENDRDSQFFKEAIDIANRALPREYERKEIEDSSRCETDVFIGQFGDGLPPSLNDRRAVVSLLHDSFEALIKNLKQQYEGLCDFFYDSLATPYPSSIYVTVHPQAMIPMKISPSCSSGCPKTLLQLSSTAELDNNVFTKSEASTDECSDDDNIKEMESIKQQVVEIPDATLLIASIFSLGSTLIKEIELV